jgi:hypothetical protein
MTYQSNVRVFESRTLWKRVTACAAMEGQEEPGGWVTAHQWTLATQPGWGDAWTYFLDTNQNSTVSDPGDREDVITDGMILSAVQALRAV